MINKMEKQLKQTIVEKKIEEKISEWSWKIDPTFLMRVITSIGYESPEERYAQAKQVIGLLAKANTKEEFLNEVLKIELLNRQLYFMLSKESGRHKYTVMRTLDKISKPINTLSEAGSVLVGNDSFSVSIKNGYGDGESTVYVLNETDNFEDDLMEFSGVVAGTEFYISSYDCDNSWITKLPLSGKYMTYYYDSIVCLRKI
ncbi:MULTISPECIES: hypothetical protein [unclassified Facklamia]|uniref:hypothetical protein n=1 Tax=Aerococcaceae TaxID=186827 RepID=UPI0013B9E315|nr:MULTISPECIES: hypothetical protein [unclassified Facklamia]NEW65317.1 hypothetical protein [Facklamia sp. 252]NEW68337.1 hypothetical protein [Facklamia sp. 253]QQD66157.1 hypothetical protein JDW14_03365 [Aerococcaceae bacterium zg-252]